MSTKSDSYSKGSTEVDENILRATRIQNAIRQQSMKQKRKLQPIEVKAIPYELRNAPAVMNVSTKDFRQLLQSPTRSPSPTKSNAWA